MDTHIHLHFVQVYVRYLWMFDTVSSDMEQDIHTVRCIEGSEYI